VVDVGKLDVELVGQVFYLWECVLLQGLVNHLLQLKLEFREGSAIIPKVFFPGVALRVKL
jgi:hypothetical protein